MANRTDYHAKVKDLTAVIRGANAMDDLMAMILAARRLPAENVAKWISKAGPLPLQRHARDQLSGVVRRGMEEVKTYLKNQGLV